jgi:hypothetical protein
LGSEYTKNKTEIKYKIYFNYNLNKETEKIQVMNEKGELLEINEFNEIKLNIEKLIKIKIDNETDEIVVPLNNIVYQKPFFDIFLYFGGTQRVQIYIKVNEHISKIINSNIVKLYFPENEKYFDLFLYDDDIYSEISGNISETPYIVLINGNETIMITQISYFYKIDFIFFLILSIPLSMCCFATFIILVFKYFWYRRDLNRYHFENVEWGKEIYKKGDTIVWKAKFFGRDVIVKKVSHQELDISRYFYCSH